MTTKYKVYRLKAFNKEKVAVPLITNTIYVDVESCEKFDENILIVNGSTEALADFYKKMEHIKSHPKFKDKFVITNNIEDPTRRLEFMTIEELEGTT